MRESMDPPRFLLLLPPCPSPPSPASLKAGYGETIRQTFTEITARASDSHRASVLEIALALPHLVDHERLSRSSLHAATQDRLAAVYRLVGISAAERDINLETSDGVDVRVLLVAWDPRTSDKAERCESGRYGPIISIGTLAQSSRAWKCAFGVKSETGEAMMRAFVAAKGSGEEFVRLRSGPVMRRAGTDDVREDRAGVRPANVERLRNRHHHVAIGGTFDHIHIGHKLLLTMATLAVDHSELSDAEERTLTVGITGEQLLKAKKHAEVLESWEERCKSVVTFINAIVDFTPPAALTQRRVSQRDAPGANGKSTDVHYPNGWAIRCTEIQDPFGPTITEERISAMVISAETRAGGNAVNDKRSEKCWTPLELFEVDILDRDDGDDDESDRRAKANFEHKLSSTAIRERIVKQQQSSL